jgi:hypothetical protein
LTNGPTHYRNAEHALKEAARLESGSDHERYFLAKAQVHATLAAAAATAELNSYTDYGAQTATGRTSDESKAWKAAFNPSTD